MEFEDKVGIVTGAGQGIGRKIAEKVAGEGAAVIISDINTDTGNQTVEQIKKSYHAKSVFLKTDVRELGEVQSLIDFTKKEFGKIDFLVNNAGILTQTRIQDISQKEWDEVLAVNLRGVFFCSQAVMPHMKKQRHGRIVNMASVAGKIGGMAAGAHYAVSKAGVICLTKVFARELAPFGVTVNAVAPGFVNTNLIQGFSPGVIEKYKKNCPLGKLAETDDVAEAVLFLVSDGAKHITGEILDVNGGILMD